MLSVGSCPKGDTGSPNAPFTCDSVFFFACRVALNTKDRGILVSLRCNCSGHGRLHILLECEKPCSHTLLPPLLWFSPESSKGTGLPCCTGFGSPVNPKSLPQALPAPPPPLPACHTPGLAPTLCTTHFLCVCSGGPLSFPLMPPSTSSE